MRDLSSPTWDGTHAPCGGSTESYPLHCQVSPQKGISDHPVSLLHAQHAELKANHLPLKPASLISAVTSKGFKYPVFTNSLIAVSIAPVLPLRYLSSSLYLHHPPLTVPSDQISRPVVSDSLQPHESQHARPPCPSPTPGVHSDSRPSSQ